MRGENPYSAGSAVPTSGSSPHARGKRNQIDDCGPGNGLIPACAGKTMEQENYATLVGAHPRMRGENALVLAVRLRLVGSSPHARGKLSLSCSCLAYSRLIPACAGKTARCCVSRRGGRAHPRMRGENTESTHAPQTPQGSSPHARGKLSLTWINTEQSSQLDTTYHAPLLI